MTAKEEAGGAKTRHGTMSEGNGEVPVNVQPGVQGRPHGNKGSRWQINLHLIPFQRGLHP